MIDELAPHQRELAAMLGKRPRENVRRRTDSADGLRAGWLAELRSNPSRALDGLQRTVEEHTGQARQSQLLADLALKFSENTDRAEPEPVYRPCGSPGTRVSLLSKQGQPVKVTLTAETGGYLEQLCGEHRQVLDDAGKLQAIDAPGAGGPSRLAGAPARRPPRGLVRPMRRYSGPGGRRQPRQRRYALQLPQHGRQAVPGQRAMLLPAIRALPSRPIESAVVDLGRASPAHR